MTNRLIRSADFLMPELPGVMYARTAIGSASGSISAWSRASLNVVIFTSDRVVKNRVALSSEATRVVEIPGGDWHSVVFHAPAAIVLEVKAGPYKPLLDKEFASWAPPEDDPAATLFVTRLEAAAPGERL
jgi:hypothetical protein